MYQSIILSVASFLIVNMCFTSDLQAAGNRSKIVGDWVPASVSKSGFGVIKEFKENGQFVLHTGIIMSMTYKTDNNKLVSTIQGEKVTQTFKVSKDKLVITEKSGKEKVLERVKGSKGKGLVGKWTGKHNSGRQQQIEFTDTNNMYFEIILKSHKGTYKVNGNTIVEKLEGQPEKTWNWNLENGFLNMNESKGEKVYKFKKRNK
jgi:hypothetical protein